MSKWQQCERDRVPRITYLVYKHVSSGHILKIPVYDGVPSNYVIDPQYHFQFETFEGYDK